MPMTPFNIDLRPSVPKVRVAAWVASALLIVVACFIAWRLISAMAEVAAVEALIAPANEAVKALEARQRTAAARPPYSDAMNELVRISTFPLNDVFAALERVDVPGVRVVELQIDASQHQATSLLEAESAEALQAYLEVAVISGRWQLQEIRTGSWTGVDPMNSPGQAPTPLPAEPSAASAAALRLKMLWNHLDAAKSR